MRGGNLSWARHDPWLPEQYRAASSCSGGSPCGSERGALLRPRPACPDTSGLPDGARSGDVPARERNNPASAGESDLMVVRPPREAVRSRSEFFGTAPGCPVGLTGCESATPCPPVTFAGFATVRESPVSAGQRPTMFVAVRSDSPPFGARCCICCCTSPRALGRVDGASFLARLWRCPDPGERWRTPGR
jgi:hypothetical protein